MRRSVRGQVFASSNDHGLTRFTPAGYAELGSRSFWPNTNNMFTTQVNDVLFHLTGNHSLKAGGEYKHVNIFRSRRNLKYYFVRAYRQTYASVSGANADFELRAGYDPMYEV